VPAETTALSVPAGGLVLAGDDAGEGQAIVLLHGLTATRRYVVMGSRLLERSGMRVISYDARGHGASEPAPEPRAYGYEDLSSDLLAVMDDLAIERAILAGASMGAHTALALALAHPERVRALAIITPGFDPTRPDGGERLERWDALAEGLRNGGIDGFVAAYGIETLSPRWREVIETVLRQRLAAHAHPLAVADALEAVPRSQPFGSLDELREISVPTIVIASRDEPDPGHPLAVSEAYAEAIPEATLVVEQEGSPIAWQGGQLSRVLLGLAERAAAESP
jgi:pimeloyl-ACP methyl ester carboxylesterase